MGYEILEQDKTVEGFPYRCAILHPANPCDVVILEWGRQGYWSLAKMEAELEKEGVKLPESAAEAILMVINTNKSLGVSDAAAMLMLEGSMFGNWPKTLEQYEQKLANTHVPSTWPVLL
jgi:hypothetical protein